jgi:hypothetical protein
MRDSAAVLQQIKALLDADVEPTTFDYKVAGYIYMGTLSLANSLYGATSPQVEAIKQARQEIESWDPSDGWKHSHLVNACNGFLQHFKDEVENGRVNGLRLEYQGQVFADLIGHAKAAMVQGYKDVASVLACTALEDCLKRFAEVKGLNVEDKELGDVANALKGAGHLSVTQVKLIDGMRMLRNKSLHAEWTKVDEPSVQSAIAFVEQFLIEKFG